LNAPSPESHPDKAKDVDDISSAGGLAIICPVCGAATVQEKCKVICKSDLCRGRVIMNCAEF
jgi:hypothetical protein